MRSTEELRKKFQKRDLTTVPNSAPTPPVLPKEAQFVPIRRKGLAGDAVDREQQVSEEALIDEQGVVGIGG